MALVMGLVEYYYIIRFLRMYKHSDTVLNSRIVPWNGRIVPWNGRIKPWNDCIMPWNDHIAAWNETIIS